jgi:DNA ligase-1
MLPVIVTFPTLYGVSSKGIVKVWKIAVHKGVKDAMIVVEHGQWNGKMQTSPETIREGKNTGKANETSAFEQAQLEAQSKWKKKHDSNYTDVYPDLNYKKEPEFKILPMLAQKYKERAKHIVWPAFIQPKLNGVRCLVERKGNTINFWSRKAKLYKNFNLYMEQEFLSFMKDGEILDGEMYNHGDVTFQELMSLIKDEKNPEIDKLKKLVKFHCYDHPDTKLGFKDRYFNWRQTVPNGQNYLRLVETIKIIDPKHIDKVHGEYTSAGYEGSIIRSGGDEPYNFQYRDNQLQKHKDFMDDEFEIVGCDQGVGKDEGKAIFVCKIKGGLEFSVRCKGADSVRQEQWTNRKKYMGKELTVRYQTLSDDGIPIFPVGIIVRDYE